MVKYNFNIERRRDTLLLFYYSCITIGERLALITETYMSFNFIHALLGRFIGVYKYLLLY
jgi:hypothetical protein